MPPQLSKGYKVPFLGWNKWRRMITMNRSEWQPLRLWALADSPGLAPLAGPLGPQGPVFRVGRGRGPGVVSRPRGDALAIRPKQFGHTQRRRRAGLSLTKRTTYHPSAGLLLRNPVRTRFRPLNRPRTSSEGSQTAVGQRPWTKTICLFMTSVVRDSLPRRGRIGPAWSAKPSRTTASPTSWVKAAWASSTRRGHQART